MPASQHPGFHLGPSTSSALSWGQLFGHVPKGQCHTKPNKRSTRGGQRSDSDGFRSEITVPIGFADGKTESIFVRLSHRLCRWRFESVTVWVGDGFGWVGSHDSKSTELKNRKWRKKQKHHNKRTNMMDEDDSIETPSVSFVYVLLILYKETCLKHRRPDLKDLMLGKKKKRTILNKGKHL